MIPSKDLKHTEQIGSGSFGRVYKGEWRFAEVAIKYCTVITKMDAFQHEADLMTNMLQHPNIVQPFGITKKGEFSIGIVMEYCAGGSLDKLLFNPKNDISKEEKIRYAVEIAHGLEHLHNSEIVHRDLAARNILLTVEGKSKITDFGLSRVLKVPEGKTYSNFGPIRWMVVMFYNQAIVLNLPGNFYLGTRGTEVCLFSKIRCMELWDCLV